MAISTDKLYGLPEQDLAVLRQMMGEWKRRQHNSLPPPDAPGEDNQRSTVFAYIPASGIPARVDTLNTTEEEADAGITGTGTGTGTGTAATTTSITVIDLESSIVYGVECQLFLEEWDDQGQRTLRKVEGWVEYVFNPNDAVFAGNQLVPTVMSPWGSRIPAGGSTSPAGVIGFRVLSAGPFVYSDLPECGNGLKVLAEVTEVGCGTAGVSLGDRVIIYDPRHCKFDLPIKVLLGALGTAVKMVNTMTTDFGNITPACADYEELVSLTCRWVVTDLSCCEECYACD